MPISLRRFTKVTLIGLPLFFFAGGLHCIYQAWYIHKDHLQEKEINELLIEAGVFRHGRSIEER